MKINNPFKKPTPPVEEKKPVSLLQMKLKFNQFCKNVDNYIAKYEEMVDKKIKRAAELKLKGMNAAVEIKDVVRYKGKIVSMERRKSVFARLIESVEENELQKEFLATMRDMTSILSDSTLDMDEIAKVNEKIMDETLRLSEMQKEAESKMDELDSALDSYYMMDNNDFNEIEKNLNELLERTIQDSRLSTENASAEDIARSVSGKIKITESN